MNTRDTADCEVDRSYPVTALPAGGSD